MESTIKIGTSLFCLIFILQPLLTKPKNSDAGTARVYYKKALDQFELYPGTEHEQCDLLNELGAMSISAGNATEAEGYSQRAATLAASSQNIKAGIQAKILQADCLRLAGKEEESEEVLLGVLRMAEVKADVNLKRAAKEALTRLSPEPSDSMEDLVVEMCGKLITMKGHVERGNLEAALRAAEEGLVIAKQLQQGPAPETPFHLAIAQIKGLMSAMQPQRIGAAHRKNH